MNIFSANEISADDFGLLYGFSLFETFLVNKNGNVFLLGNHIERLYNSMNYFGFENEFDKNQIKGSISEYILGNNIINKIFRITVTYGNLPKGTKPSIIFSVRENPYKSSDYSTGIKLTTASFKKSASAPLLAHKTGNYLENFIEGQNALKSGFNDAIFLNTDNNVTETTKSNIFFVSKGILHTPHISCGLLPGIIRGWIIERAKDLGIDCAQAGFSLESLISADEVFVTNSAYGIMPVASIDGRPIKCGTTGKITRLLLDRYRFDAL